jgi:hypothetical protein
MHSPFGLCRRALTSVRIATVRAVAAMQSSARSLSGKGFRSVLLLGALPLALAAAAFGFVQFGMGGVHAAAASRRQGHRAGPADWWANALGSASPAALFIDNAARAEWYSVLAFEAQHAVEPAPGGGGHYVHGGSTGACGGATNGADQYISRESGGDPGAVNQGSGAYGCYQIMPSTWASSCSDLGPQSGSSASTQAQCASRLPSSAWGG